MAKIEVLAPFIFKWEGGFVNHPDDPGGATNLGVTIGVWKQQGYDKDGDRDIDVADLKLITKADATKILKNNYWNRWLADSIKSQAVANILVDWVWCSGAWGIKIPQRLLGVKEDGIIGYLTLEALNNRITKEGINFTVELYKARENYINDIITVNPRLKVFKKGWLNRLADIKKFNTKIT